MKPRAHQILPVSVLEWTHSALKISKWDSWWQWVASEELGSCLACAEASLIQGSQVLGRMLQRVNRQRWNVLTDHLTKVGYEVPIQISGFQTFSCSAVSNMFVCPGRLLLLLLLVFDRFFMSFVQRVTHVQNMSTAVYYWDLCVLHRRVFSLFL